MHQRFHRAHAPIQIFLYKISVLSSTEKIYSKDMHRA